MSQDTQTIASLVEIVTREVLSANIGKDAPKTGAQIAGDAPASAGDLNLAGMIDHTLLKPDATPEKITKLCAEAREHHFFSVCVNPLYVKLCARLLQGSPVKVCSVIGFPLGAALPEVKVIEARMALEDGASELDMVLAIGALKAGDTALVAQDIRGVVATAHAAGALVKVILETCLLTDEEKITACLICKEAGADFVKTSTGFSASGATVEDVRLMRRTVGPEMGVKAAGGVSTREAALKMIQAGATRIGSSAGIKIIGGAAPEPAPAAPPSADDLRKRVHAAAAARLGSQMDPALVDAILQGALAAVAKK